MNFASKFVIYGNLLGSFTCCKAGTWDRFFYFPSEGRHTEDFPDSRKIQRLRPGLNPRTRVPVASMLTTRPPKSSERGVSLECLRLTKTKGARESLSQCYFVYPQNPNGRAWSWAWNLDSLGKKPATNRLPHGNILEGLDFKFLTSWWRPRNVVKWPVTDVGMPSYICGWDPYTLKISLLSRHTDSCHKWC